MISEKKLKTIYFDWLVELVCEQHDPNHTSYQKLLRFLNNNEFIFSIAMDENRYADGMYLRYRFTYEHPEYKRETDLYLDGPCTVLEMMVALALRCEENIMDDPEYGNRTGQWFWNMIVSLGFGGMTDYNFDEPKARIILKKFLHRNYRPNGRGGLFTIKHSDIDLRSIEIWHQLCLYLNTIA